MKSLVIRPRSPWTNAYCESFISKLCGEFPRLKILRALIKQAQISIALWRRRNIALRPHSAFGYLSPAPKALLPRPVMPPYARAPAAFAPSAHNRRVLIL